MISCTQWQHPTVSMSSWQVALESLAFQNVGASIHACEAIAELVTDANSLRCGSQ